MMISPNTYISQFEDADYFDLIARRDQLIAYIQNYEKNEITGDHSGDEWMISPGPNVRYQIYFDYLAELCKLMREKYNTEYVCGDRKLAEDYKIHIEKQPNKQR